MEGVVFRGNRQLEVVHFEDPTPGPNDVIVQIKASGFCGSDLHLYRGPTGSSLLAKSEDYLAERGLTYGSPIVAGHEPCGIVAEVGRNVDRRAFRVGDRVMVFHYDGCRYCDECRGGWVVMCSRGSTVYGQTDHGGHAHYMKVPAKALIPLPDELSFAAGAAVSCGTGTAFGTLDRLKVNGSDTLAVFGLGPVGISTIQIAKAMGIKTYAIDISEQRVAAAKDFGADITINSSNIDPIEALMEHTRGNGVSAAVDTTGVESARQAAVRSTSRWGRIALVGIGKGLFSLDVTADLILKQRTIVGHLTFSDILMARCAKFVAEKGIDLDKQFSHRWSLHQAKEAYELFDRQTSGKSVFEF